jgi:hypothetical protein
MIVTVQVSNVLSPATLKILPLKGTSIDAIFDAGSAADLHNILKVGVLIFIPAGGDGILTSNRLGRAPPPISADLKS